jgi:shikimate dehydrogenase
VSGPASHPTLALADLAAWPAGTTGLAVLGRPVAHSLSPAMHTAALAALARDDAAFAAWRYVKIDIAPEQLAEALAALHAAGFRGVNLTMPHKEAVLAHAAPGDDFVRAAGAANTLVRSGAGWRAFNTDGGGLSDAVREDLGLALAGRPVVLLGAGGAARAAAVQCCREGAAAVWIGNRGTDRLAALLRDLAPFAGATAVRGFALDVPPADLPPGALVVNATTAGLRTDDPPPVDLRRLPRPAGVYDMIYHPPATALLRGAAALGVPWANGLGMLVHQGVRSLALWTGAKPRADLMRAAVEAAPRRESA